MKTCQLCDRPFKGRGLCETHLKRLRRTGTTDPRPKRLCGEPGCYKVHESRGQCAMHAQRRRKAARL